MKVRLAIQQRVIPHYRAPFLELLAKDPEIELGVIAGAPLPDENINIVDHLEGVDYSFTKNIHISKGKSYFCLQPDLIDWVRQWKPDVLVVEANPRYLSTPSTIRLMKKKQKPVIGWGLGVPKNSGFFSFFRNYFRNQFLGSFTNIIAYSHRGAEQYIDAGFNPENVFVAMNATDPAPIGPPPTRSLMNQESDFVLLYVGRLQSRKKLDVLIKVCSQLPERIQPNLWIVGDGPVRSELESLANAIYPKAKFWGEKFGKELDTIFLQADLFVLPGTGGLAVQQAMAHALPVIVAEGDGTQSDLVNNNTGWIINSDDPQELLKKLTAALESPAELRQKGLSAYQIIQTKVNIEQMVSVFKQASFDAINRVKQA